MPEENFEQQARRLAEPFSMEPAPAVWQNVKAAIAPERKRRILLWWWLLPVCLAGGIAVHLFKNDSLAGKDNLLPIAATKTSVDSSSSEISSSESQRSKREQNALKEKVTGKTDNHLDSLKETLNENKKGEKRERGLSETRQYQAPYTFKQEEKRSAVEVAVPATKLAVKERNNAAEALPSIAGAKQQSDNKPTDSLQFAQAANGKRIEDTATENAVITSVSADSAKTADPTLPVAIVKKKILKKSISIGVLAEIGKASINSPFAGNEEKIALQALSDAAPSAYFSISTGTITKYKLSSGVNAAIGVAAQKRLSSAFSLSAQATYRYQQFGIAQTVFIDTTTAGNGGGSGSNGSPGTGRGVYYPVSAVQRLHFANIYTSTGWRFFNRKRLALAVGAGVDNAFLLSITQKQNSSADSVKNLQTKDFYHWQPSLQFTLPVDVYTGKTSHIELSPFVRFGLRRFQKSNASYDGNRLSSSGIQAIYFFK